MAKPKHPLYSFAVRMLLVLMGNGLIWTVAVQLYYQHKTSEQTLKAVQEELTALEPQLKKHIHQSQAHLIDFLENTMLEREIPFLQVYKKGHGVIFSKGTDTIPAKYSNAPTQWPPVPSPAHRLIKINDRHYLYLFRPVFDSEWYMRAAIPVNPGFINGVEETTHTILMIVIVTLFQASLVMLPLMLAAYNRTLKDRGDLLLSQLLTIQALGNAIAKRDSATDAHNYRVSYYALRLAEEVGLNPARMPGLIKGAFLHDVGKIGVPDSVLLKPGRLSQREYDIVQKHVSDGLEIIAGIPWLREAAPVISAHHEHYDGMGYPNGLKGENIPLEARIFSVVDVFDALTSKRPYKEALTVDRALQVMDEANERHFDPAIYGTFRNLAASLLKQASDENRKQLRRLLIHAILPYFHFVENQHQENADATKD